MIMHAPARHDQPSATRAQPPRSRGRRWIALILGLIGLNMSIVFVTVRAAVSDPSFAIEPAFYQKAVEWDRAAGEQAGAQLLGWSLAARVDERGTLIADLTEPGPDGTRRPLAGADVQAEAFAQARSGQRVAVHLAQQPGGEYAAALNARRGGLWEVRFTARKSGTVYRHTETVLLGD